MNAGESVFVLPEIQQDDIPWLGISARTFGLQPGSSVEVRLASVVGPGHVSLWYSAPFGEPIAQWASADGISTADTLSLSTNTHSHFSWGFTQPGNYLLNVEVDGTLQEELHHP